MPVNRRLLSETLNEESSIVRLPRILRWKAVRILGEIKKHTERRIQLSATELRGKVQMDTHSFVALFKWLQKHEYCMTTKGMVIRKRKTVPAKLVYLTSKGESAVPPLPRRPRFGDLRQIAKEFHNARSAREEADTLLELIVESFNIAYSEFYHAGVTEGYDWFRGEIENRLRDHLESERRRKPQNRMEAVDDVYLIVRQIPRMPLLEDAKLARERGHFLTENHRYVLRVMEHVKEKDLIGHNVRWRDRVMSAQFTGRESPQEFRDMVDPMEIVEQERKERQTSQLLGPQTVTFARDSYCFDDRWKIDVAELKRRWNQSPRAKYRARKALMDDERRDRLEWLTKNHPWRIRESEILPLILYEDIS